MTGSFGIDASLHLEDHAAALRVLALVRVKLKRAHLEDGHWVTLHRLTVLDEAQTSRARSTSAECCWRRAPRRQPSRPVVSPSRPCEWR